MYKHVTSKQRKFILDQENLLSRKKGRLYHMYHARSFFQKKIFFPTNDAGTRTRVRILCSFTAKSRNFRLESFLKENQVFISSQISSLRYRRYSTCPPYPSCKQFCLREEFLASILSVLLCISVRKLRARLRCKLPTSFFMFLPVNVKTSWRCFYAQNHRFTWFRIFSCCRQFD